MSNDKMREEFEAWYLDEYYEGDKQCGLEWLSTESCGGYRYAEPAREWKTWQASREALVIDLPKIQFIQSSEEFQQSCLKIRYCDIAAIEAAGVKVKP